MDSHSFRTVSSNLLKLLTGARVEKIHGPHPGVTVFNLFTGGKKLRLVLRHERQNPLVFVTEQPIANPPAPPAAVMRLRKYIGGRRLAAGVCDYVGRRVAFSVAAAPGEKPPFLVLDLVHGPYVAFALPDEFAPAPQWPGTPLVETLCDIVWRKGDKEGPWQDYAVLTPLLRETLAALDPFEGRALMADLEDGGGDLFVYSDREGKAVLYTAWPLPESLCARRNLEQEPIFISGDVAEEARCSVLPAFSASLLPDFPVLACVSLVDESRFFHELGQGVRKEEAAPAKKASKKTSRLLAKLEQEEKRLHGMLAERAEARLIQSVLWQYPAETRLSELRVQDEDGREHCIALNSLMSVRENMSRMFHRSDRGERGLAMLKERKAAVEAGAAEFGEAAVHASSAPVAPSGEGATASAGLRLVEDPQKQIPDVARFLSSDGFVLLRGKNAKGNRRLLKEGKGHDIWMHAEGGPSAHLVVRRAHVSEEVPERTLREAARLVGEKSWQRDDARAHIMTALLRHVHPVKGGAPGSVRVDTVLSSVTVSLLPDGPDSGGESPDGADD